MNPETKGDEEEIVLAAETSSKVGRRKKKLEDDTPEKKKEKEIEYKLNKLKCTMNDSEVRGGKRAKRAPERFSLPTPKKRSCALDTLPSGKGVPLGAIPWVSSRLGKTPLCTLRLLHRTIFRKQGNFIEKKIIKEVWKFRGFPFDANHKEVEKRRLNLEKQKASALGYLCDVLGVRRGDHAHMVDAILRFLLCPGPTGGSSSSGEPAGPKYGSLNATKNFSPLTYNTETGNTGWRRPAFFSEGNGVKLKYIRAVASNIEMANDGFIELLHRLLYLTVDEVQNMRKSILEFSGVKCDPGTNNYIYRTKILSQLPSEQVRLVCRVLGLPTWHRSRQQLADGIMDFVAAPRISALKRKVPPHFSDAVSFSFETEKNSQPEQWGECEKIEVYPDIHILPDDEEEEPPFEDCDSSPANEYLGVKLKNIADIYYQVINAPAAKLNDLHMIMYLTSCPPQSVRSRVLEFSGFPFPEDSKGYFCRKSFMEQMSLEEVEWVACVLCVSQCVTDASKGSLIQAVLKFLLKPAALLNSSTLMPSLSIPPQTYPEILISEVKTLAKATTTTHGDATPSTDQYEEELERVKACLSSDIEIVAVTKGEPPSEKKPKANDIEMFPVSCIESSLEGDIPLSRMKHAGDDSDEDDRPLSKMIGHPNDEQLRALVTKIVKVSKLEDVTMKIVIKKVFENYPHFDLGYRKEFIKSIVRQILSQMEDQSHVSTTVVNI